MPGSVQPGVGQLAIDNTSAAAMCSGGPGSQRTRHLKIRAAFIRESVSEGRITVRHTPGDAQLADLATKLQPKMRLWRLLSLWGFIGDRLTGALNSFKTTLLTVVVMLSSLVAPTTGAKLDGKKEPLAATGWEELTFLLVLSCVAVIGVWEAFKATFGFYKRWIKGARKSRKLKKVSELAAEAAKREVASQAGMSLTSERSSDLRFAAGASSSSWNEAFEEPALRRRPTRSTATSPLSRPQHQAASVGSVAPPRRRAPTEEEVLPSPGAQSSVSGGLEDLDERARVVKDVLSLLTCEELRAGLRAQGYLTTGVKSDLVDRFSVTFFPASGRNDLPTVRQLKVCAVAMA